MRSGGQVKASAGGLVHEFGSSAVLDLYDLDLYLCGTHRGHAGSDFSVLNRFGQPGNSVAAGFHIGAYADACGGGQASSGR